MTGPDLQTSAQMTGDHREHLGRRVREVWLAWVREQRDAEFYWVETWDILDERAKEIARRIGETLWRDGFNSAVVAFACSIPDVVRRAVALARAEGDELRDGLSDEEQQAEVDDIIRKAGWPIHEEER